MFDQFDLAEDKMLQVIDNNGKVISKELMPKLSDEEMLKLYKDMLFVRTLDHMIVSYQRQGRVYTYPQLRSGGYRRCRRSSAQAR